jgi:integrase
MGDSLIAPINLPYIWRTTAKGRVYWYFRRDGLRVRLPGEPGSPEFLAAYAKHMEPVPLRQQPQGGTMAALIDAYEGSAEWRQLKPATHKDYMKFLPVWRERYGDRRVATIDRSAVFKIRARHAETSNRQGNKAVAVLSALLSWAVDHGYRTDNPALRPKRLKVSGGYRAWTDAEIDTFLEKAPAHLRLACLLALGTAQRGSDLAKMTWASYRAGEIEVIQQKTGERVWIPVHGRVKAALDAQEKKTVTILTTDKGRPHTVGWFQHEVSHAIRAAGLSGVVAHGWRTTALTWLADAGCSPHQIAAISGHTTLKMIEGYTRGANKRALAKAAIVKLQKRK